MTTDELFAEDFKPLWLLRKERLIKESFEYAMQTTIDLRYKQEAYAKAKKIAEKWRKC